MRNQRSTEDLGIQVSLDGEPWRMIKVFSPGGGWQRVLQVNGAGSVRQLGLTEFFMESNEPSFEEVPPEEILAIEVSGNQTITESAFETEEE